MDYNDFDDDYGVNWKQIYARKKIDKECILRIAPNVIDESGIYILTRIDENGFKYAYVGQSVHVLTRLAQHLSGYQHIDLSLKKHGLYDAEKRPYGWKIARVIYCPESELDEQEKEYIRKCADAGMQLRNHSSGGQGQGKSGIDSNRPAKGYYDGKKQGYEDCRKQVQTWFEKYLSVGIKDKPNKIKERALQKFLDFLEKKD